MLEQITFSKSVSLFLYAEHETAAKLRDLNLSDDSQFLHGIEISEHHLYGLLGAREEMRRLIVLE